jgi:small multidrug resistance pump
MGYLFLVLTILSESAAVLFMKLANGFQDKIYTALAVVTYAAGFVFLTLTLKHLPVGIANAIWAGASTVLIVIAGALFFKENLNILQLIFLAFIVIGLVGLNIVKQVK